MLTSRESRHGKTREQYSIYLMLGAIPVLERHVKMNLGKGDLIFQQSKPSTALIKDFLIGCVMYQLCFIQYPLLNI